ncbi:MAG: hypothetical protein NZ891_02300 [bacterium]|nr:hypothetical protein [bacterium]MDW8163555.1 hypothetical protein [Candidatus Omnitrophota bacterium]
MNCNKLAKFVILYLENKVNKKYKKEIEEHLKNCMRCREYLFFVKELLNKKLTENKNNWEELKEKILNKINNYIQKLDIRKIRLKKGLISILFVFSFVSVYFTKIQIKNHITKYFHLYKDYEIIQNLDQLKELIDYEEEEYIKNE